MNRLLIALLALLTGLVTQVAPANARLCGASDTEIGAVECNRATARATAPQAAQSDAAPARAERREREGKGARATRPRVFIPSVLFGPDRAFE